MLCVRVHVCIIIVVIKNIPLFCSTYHSFEYLHSKQFADCDFENIYNYTTYPLNLLPQCSVIHVHTLGCCQKIKACATVPNDSRTHIRRLPKDEGMALELLHLHSCDGHCSAVCCRLSTLVLCIHHVLCMYLRTHLHSCN